MAGHAARPGEALAVRPLREFARARPEHRVRRRAWSGETGPRRRAPRVAHDRARGRGRRDVNT